MSEAGGVELHHLEFRLSWGECDPAGIMYFASLLPWMERVHTEWLFLIGERPDAMAERHGVSTVVRRASCDYLLPTRVFDPLRVGVSLRRVGTTSVLEEFAFTKRDTGALHARGEMVLVFVDAGGRPVRPPDTLRAVWSLPAPPA